MLKELKKQQKIIIFLCKIFGIETFIKTTREYWNIEFSKTKKWHTY